MSERRVPFRRWRTWTRFVAPEHADAGPPILFVPGGPGAPHDYMVEQAALFAARGRGVWLYDPIGSGHSDRPSGVTWTLALFVDELATLIDALAPTGVHLFGSSAGGLVALLHALAAPPAVHSLTLSGTPLDVPAYEAGIERLVRALPEEIAAPLTELTRDRPATPAFMRAWDLFMKRHVCRVPLPPVLQRASRRINSEAHRALKGDLLRFTGALRDFDITPRLGELAVPVLFTLGRHDSLLPELAEAWVARIPGGRVALFEDSSHMPYLEEPARFADVVCAFLDEVDALRRSRR